MEIVLHIGLLVVGFLMLIKGADWFVEGASKIADRFGIPQLVIGLTIVAFGTSAPEAAVSITAALKGSADITIGNVIGSNIMNILIILGLTAVIVPLSVQVSTLRYEIPFVVLITIVLGVLGLTDGIVGRGDGVLLWAGMILFLLYLFRMAKKGEAVTEEVAEADANDTLAKLLISVLVGMGLIVWGADISVKAATELARVFGMEERLIALTIVALGTSLPELITSVTAGIKGKADIAIGNIVGSNIFNILFVVGTTALIMPVAYDAKFIVDTTVAVLAAAMLFFFVLRERKLKRLGGAVMLTAYAGYFVYLIQ